MRSYPVKESPIGSAVSEILRYTQTDTQTNKQTSCYFIIRIIALFVIRFTYVKKNFNNYFFFYRGTMKYPPRGQYHPQRGPHQFPDYEELKRDHPGAGIR